MAKFWRSVPGLLLCLVSALAGCEAPERDDEQTTTARSALTTSLFQPYVAYATGSWPEAVAIGDLDGDGRNDVALLTSYYFDAANDYMVHVFLQNSDGTLKPRVKYPVGLRGSSIDIGDVNGDGRADVVVGLANGAGIQLGVLLQNAAGTLDPMVSYPTVNSYSVKVGDFNGDGRMDIAGINWGSYGDGLDLFLQTETGTLAAPVTYHVTHGGWDELDAGDIDGDGRTDLVVMSGQTYALPNLNVLLQTSDGTLGPPTAYSVGTNINTAGVAIGDANGDGRSDLVVSYGGNRPSSFIGRFLQNAAGAIEPVASYASYDIPSAIVMADADGDGRKDVLVTHSGWARLGVYRQYPSGAFGGEELYQIGSASHFRPQGLAVGDINGDGRPDAVIADSIGGLIVLRHVQETALALTLTTPVAGGLYYLGVPLTVRWAAGDTIPLAGFDVSASFNGGSSYTAIPGCTGLAAAATECTWTSPGPAYPAVRVRVTARDTAGQTASAESTFNLAAASVTVTAPTASQFVGVGGTTTISWSHNLPAGETVRVELSRDGGASYEETLVAATPVGNVSSTQGSFTWTVTGPTTSSARVRVSANGSVAASGSISFAITATPTLTVQSPGNGSIIYTNSFSATWTSNAGNIGTVTLGLSRDGGATYETLANAIPNLGSFTGAIAGPSAAAARVRVTMTTSFGVVTATGPSFTLIKPELAVTSPAAGAMLSPGTTVAITWSTNLPSSWTKKVELSRDGGSTYEVLTWNAPNATSFNWVVAGAVTYAAQVRVTITGQGTTVATSGTFAIATPSLTVTAPVAGEALYVGSPLAITWSTNLLPSAQMRIELSRDGGSTFWLLAAMAPNTGSFATVVSGPATGNARVYVTAVGYGPSASSGTFAIVEPSLAVTSPAAGAALYAGTPLSITWSTNLPPTSPVLVELSRDGGSTFETLAAAAPNTGSFTGIVPGPDAATAVARVTIANPVAVTSTGGAFSIVTPALTVTGPTAGTPAYAGTPVTISWTHNLSGAEPVSIGLTRDGGATFEVLAAAAPNTGSFVWTASGPDTAEARVRVTSSGAVPASGLGPAFPIVTPSLTVSSPAAGESWAIGTGRTISWSSSSLPAGTTVRVELSRDGGASWTTLASAAPSSGSQAWTATAPATIAARVRVSANGGVPAVGTSGTFAIGNPALSVTSPAAGASWTIGTAKAITWTSNLLPSATVKVQISRNGGGTYTTLASAAPNTGSYLWTATGAACTTALVRVSANGFTASGVSGTFSLVAASVTVTSPNTAVTWTVGTVHAITWNHNLGAGAQFKLEVSRSGIWSTIVAAAPAGGTSGSYAWTVTGPKTTSAKVRVTWTGGTVQDASDVAFKIN